LFLINAKFFCIYEIAVQFNFNIQSLVSVAHLNILVGTAYW